MTAKPKKIKSIYVIYWVLLAYIIAALVWWFIALMQQNQIMVNIRKAELIKSDYNYDLKFKAIEEDRKRKVAQYVGEDQKSLSCLIWPEVDKLKEAGWNINYGDDLNKNEKLRAHYMTAIKDIISGQIRQERDF